jgi:hypothetical protein
LCSDHNIEAFDDDGARYNLRPKKDYKVISLAIYNPIEDKCTFG